MSTQCKMYLRVVLFTLFAVVVSADEPWRIINRVWDDCGRSQDVSLCLQGKAVTFLDRAARSDFINLGESVSLVRSASAPLATREAKALSDSDVAEAGKKGTLTDLLWDRMGRFLSSHSITVDLPRVSKEQLQTGLVEGRGKMKKMMGMMMMGGAMKAMALIPLALGALFILAGKALIIAKIALVLSLIITLKKLLSAKQEEHGWQSSGGHGGGGGWDRRSLDHDIAHNLAYSAYKQ